MKLMRHNINAVCEKFAFWKHKINAVLQKKIHCGCMKLTRIGERRKVAYPENTEYCDDSSQILKDILDNDQSSQSEESERDEEIGG